MRNVMIGTAGHVDHGKTRLIRALTGMDTDRLAEEKKRGITIENGFADMILDGYNVSIIDVPGHEKFVGNMLAGIGGIDLVLLVIGLDEGVMPQTEEHFQILKTLRIKNGIIVLTKDDLVSDEEWKKLVEDDVSSLVKGSFLEGAPCIRVSSETGYNISKLKDLIKDKLRFIGDRDTDPKRFRLPVDRVFTVGGFGTVVTGTLLEGSVSREDEISVYPEDRKVRVRNLQVHGKNVDRACAGERTAVNLAGVRKDEVKRGDVLAFTGSLEPSRMLDAEIELFEDSKRQVADNGRVHFYCGADEELCKVVLMDREKLLPGERCFAQLRFDKNVALKKGDRFIIRFYSPVTSIGGGTVLDACPKKHKRGRQEVMDAMRIKASGDREKIVELTIRELSGEGAGILKLSDKLRIDEDSLKNILKKLVRDGKIAELQPGIYVHESFLAGAQTAVKEILSLYHRENPLSFGMKKEELKSRLGLKLKLLQPKMSEAVIREEEKAGEIEIKDNMIKLPDFRVAYSDEASEMRKRVCDKYRESGFEMPLTEDVVASEKNQKLCRQLIEALISEGVLVKIAPRYNMEASKYALARETLKEHVRRSGTITLGEFRDEIGTSRKYAVMILEHFDEVKFTIKIGDARRLAGKDA